MHMISYLRSIILIPTLNERDNLRDLIPGIFGLMPEISVLVVDDNSKDGTQELIEELKLKFNRLYFLERTKNFGYGRSSIDGFKLVFGMSYDNLVTMDADFSHDFNIIPGLLEKLANSDVAAGSRYVKSGGVKNWNFFRRVLSRVANFYVRIILGLPVRDATTGFNAYRTSCLRQIVLNRINSEGYAFLVELKYRLFESGATFSEYPIMFSERREGQSKMSSKIIWEAVKLPWRLKFKD